MISPTEIRKKAERIWQSQKPMQAEWEGRTFFPIEIPFSKPDAKELMENFSKLREYILDLKGQSKESLGYGYELELSLWQHRHLGSQLVPAKIRIVSMEDLCRLIGKSKDLARWRKSSVLVAQQLPQLRKWIGLAPLKVLKYSENWPLLLSVIEFFLQNPRPFLYIRQLQIPDVDTKFIEAHKKILQELLDLTLPDSAIDRNFDGSGAFEQRYGLLYDEVLVRFRSLDPMVQVGPYSDQSIPLSQFANHPLSCKQIFIVENKINALAFVSLPGALVIFGSGYGIGKLQRVPWLNEKSIYYWGDIDTHGFSILSKLRAFLPQTQSLFMDRETLMAYPTLWVKEPEDARFTKALSVLTENEQSLFQDLQTNAMGIRIRLEQERIPFEDIIEKLRTMCN